MDPSGNAHQEDQAEASYQKVGHLDHFLTLSDTEMQPRENIFGRNTTINCVGTIGFFEKDVELFFRTLTSGIYIYPDCIILLLI